MSPEFERQQFLEKIANSEPTHFQDSEDIQELMSVFNSANFKVYSSVILNKDLVTDLCISFTYKYAGYTPGNLMKENKMFFSSDPILIYSTAPDAPDRTLVWANGLIQYLPDAISILIDKDLLEMIDDGE